MRCGQGQGKGAKAKQGHAVIVLLSLLISSLNSAIRSFDRDTAVHKFATMIAIEYPLFDNYEVFL